MKKTYVSPQLILIKINSQESTAGFVSGNYSTLLTQKSASEATNKIQY